jgi:hypothetical protein
MKTGRHISEDSNRQLLCPQISVFIRKRLETDMLRLQFVYENNEILAVLTLQPE